ncbi:PadR family transcriptional regulator [Vibrio kasasachensis]|uniref:PadR family transcriptional regulator n=1 Tax=Vibrio kasasachensis TaxID=2910248 RepID=UPI003D113DB1
MQDKVILGLLSYQDQTLYQLKKVMEQSTSLFFSASTGSLHPALKKLETSGLVACRQEADGKRAKKIYSRTPKGAQIFQEWIAEPKAKIKVKDEGLLKLFFFGHINQDVVPFIQRYINEAEQWLTALEPIYEAHKQQSVPPEFAKQSFFELATLKYGIDSLKFSKQWYQDLLVEYQASELK